MYIPYILYSLLSRPTNAQMFINNSLYIVSTPSCFSASTSSSGRVDIIPAYSKHRHRDYTYKAAQIVYAATKHVLYLFTFYRLYFIIQQRSREHCSLLILLSCNFNNFVTLAKCKVKTP